MDFEFKKTNSLEKRLEQLEKIQKEYPDKIPIILERANKCTINKIIKTKYILSNTLTMAEFIKIIRGKLELEPERALFFLANGKYSLSSNEDLGQVYEKYKDSQDGFLYMTYSEEIVYGLI